MPRYYLIFLLSLSIGHLQAQADNGKVQSGTSAVDSKYLKKESINRKLKRERKHQKMEENKEDIKSYKYDSWIDNEIPSSKKSNKINNRDPRD